MSASASASRPPAVQKPPVVVPGTGNNIVINHRQRGNPVLECIRNVGKEFGDILADYQVGRTTGVLFISLKYHRLHPEYIHQRIEQLGHSYNLRVLLLLCDIKEHQEPIRELTKTCLINNITVMVAWNPEEAGYYLSTYKQFEHKPPDMIKERVDKDYHSMLRTALTSISKVNKTDVETLRTSLGSFADIARATSDQLQNLPGFGQVKAKRLKDAFEKPFRTSTTTALPFPSQSQGRLLSQASAAQSIKGKEKARSPPTEPDAGPPIKRPRQPREPSPMWDIELDLNGSLSPTPETGPPPQRSWPTPAPIQKTSSGSGERRPRPPSPVWDIELDLNGSGDEGS
ncbi:DNA repair protein rad10 [Obba rivulosa]|uniref:DNA repair protein rad10 n=1 Tax=Obba rivulosa TaxID=1052685 RepID=A0A8E2DN29_9APHY|nr:DNA repair protein rad10 [Obba rivulosa]